MKVNLSPLLLENWSAPPQAVADLHAQLHLSAPTIKQLHLTAKKVAKLLKEAGAQIVFIGRFRTVYSTILESYLISQQIWVINGNTPLQ